jgi:hypothetical protein
MYKTITNCRACQSTDLVEVFSFDRPMPLANDFTGTGDVLPELHVGPTWGGG